MFAGVNVFDHDLAARAANTRRFAQNYERLLQMMQCEPAYHNVERPTFKREILRIRSAERNIGDAALLRALLRDRKHCVRQVDANNFAGGACECFRDVSRARRNVENSLVPAEMSGRDQPPDAGFVGNPRIGRECLSLCCEGFAYDVVVFGHGAPLRKILMQGHRDRQNGRKSIFYKCSTKKNAAACMLASGCERATRDVLGMID